MFLKTTSIEDNAIADAIGTAKRHALSVVLRQHISSSDRMERLDQFVVTLRRHLGYVINDDKKRTLIDCLCVKSIWHEPGQLSSYFQPSNSVANYLQIERHQIEKWITLSNSRENLPSAQSQIISHELEELERSIGCLDQSVRSAQQINEASDALVSEFVEFFNQ